MTLFPAKGNIPHFPKNMVIIGTRVDRMKMAEPLSSSPPMTAVPLRMQSGHREAIFPGKGVAG
jgi:hypothetical protein